MIQTAIMPTYGRFPLAFERGKGVWLYDTQKNRYLDALCGIGVTNLGHAHPKVTAAIQEQAGKLLHTSNLYQIELQQALAEKLSQIAGMDNIFFCNSGAEANEAAIKLARQYAHQQGIENGKVIVMENSFHGRTMATLSATGNRAVQAGFEPLVSGFIRVPFNDTTAIENLAKNQQDIVAILVEPIQGEAGIHIPDADYLNKIRAICDANNWLLMLDEVQTGNARTGTYFAYQHTDILPDVVTTAKGLGNGIPIGACLARGVAAKTLKPGQHGSTFGGNPLACAAALAVIDTIQTQALDKQAKKLGAYLIKGLEQKLSQLDIIEDIRGKGLMLAIELKQALPDFCQQALDAGILLNLTGAGKIIRLLPPLIMTESEADILIQGLSQLLKNQSTTS